MFLKLKRKIALDMISAIMHLPFAKIPQIVWIIGSMGSICLSLVLYIFGKKHESLLVGQWAPTMLLLGIYQRFIKISGIF